MSGADAPTVEMLWEAHDPHDALRDRFGFGDAASAARWVAAALEQRWGVRVGACQRIVISERNALAWVETAAGSRVAKWSVAPERFARLAWVARLTGWLADRGLPVSAPLPSLDGRRQVELDGVSMSLQRVVRGELLDVADAGQVAAAGATLARLHLALADHPDADRVAASHHPALPPLAERIAVQHGPATARDTLGRLLDDLPDDPLPTQLVHGDYRSANVLCDDGAVVAVLDLEEARLDHAVVEVARSAVMLGTRFHDWGPVPAGVRARFRAGYESVRPLTPAETCWWDAVALWQALAQVPTGPDPTGWGRAAAAHAVEIVPTSEEPR